MFVLGVVLYFVFSLRILVKNRGCVEENTATDSD